MKKLEHYVALVAVLRACISTRTRSLSNTDQTNAPRHGVLTTGSVDDTFDRA